MDALRSILPRPAVRPGLSTTGLLLHSLLWERSDRRHARDPPANTSRNRVKASECYAHLYGEVRMVCRVGYSFSSFRSGKDRNLIATISQSSCLVIQECTRSSTLCKPSLQEEFLAFWQLTMDTNETLRSSQGSNSAVRGWKRSMLSFISLRNIILCFLQCYPERVSAASARLRWTTDANHLMDKNAAIGGFSYRGTCHGRQEESGAPLDFRRRAS